jgi:hypothetical protein
MGFFILLFSYFVAALVGLVVGRVIQYSKSIEELKRHRVHFRAEGEARARAEIEAMYTCKFCNETLMLSLSDCVYFASDPAFAAHLCCYLGKLIPCHHLAKVKEKGFKN